MIKAGYTSKSCFIKAAWPHIDQKLTHEPQRDAPHEKKIPNAFAHGERLCIQSSLYLTDCDQLAHDTFAFCPGSHLWIDEPHWHVSADRHHVSIDANDITTRCVKVACKAGDLILWYSKTIHWGHPGISETIPTRVREVVTMPLWRNEVPFESSTSIK